MINIYRGGPGDDRFMGTVDRDKLWGGGGDDMLYGGSSIDKMHGGAGDDYLKGGRGHDWLWGGGGADVFYYNAANQSPPLRADADLIMDFTHADTIDLHEIDADRVEPGNKTFDWIGHQHFHNQAGELRFHGRGTDTIIQADQDGDGRADFTIVLDDRMTLNEDDFIL